MNEPAQPFSVAGFLSDLLETGRVRAPNPAALPHFDDEANRALLLLDAHARRFAPGEPPAYDPDAARWGASTLFRACQFLVDRTTSPAAIAADFEARQPPMYSAAVVWSVDLTLQKLADLAQLARGLAFDDPLIVALGRLSADWPLSGVGLKPPTRAKLPEPNAPALDVVHSHPTLRTLYVDRIIARRDRSRLDEPRTRAAVQAALGLHVELLPEWAPLWEKPADETAESVETD